jgi:hypothetical protein
LSGWFEFLFGFRAVVLVVAIVGMSRVGNVFVLGVLDFMVAMEF